MSKHAIVLSDDMRLPVDAITQTFLIVGKRGSGKSNSGARLVEQFIRARLPVVVLDVTDTWWGLKAGREGGRGLDVYVFGGRKADLPLEAGSGALIADVLCEHRISMVLSVKHLSGRERSAFMVAFAQTLFQKWAGGQLHVVLEEAHELAPQMSGGRGSGSQDGEAAMLGAFKRLWKLGRASGIGGTAITQRPASLSKDITTQSEILIAHRTIGPQDVKAIGEWVKYHGEQLGILAELPTLPTGEAFVWAPEFPEGEAIGLKRTRVLLRETYDSASTPKVGEKRVDPKELAAVDLERLRTKMASTLERAKADDPRELKKQIAELRAQLSKAPKAGVVLSSPVLTDADLARLERLGEVTATAAALVHEDLVLAHQRFRAELTQAVGVYADNVTAIAAKAEQAIATELKKVSVQRALGKLEVIGTPLPPVTTVREAIREGGAAAVRAADVRHAPQRSAGRSSHQARPAGEDGLGASAHRLIDQLAALESLGYEAPSKTQLAVWADVSPTSGGYFNNLGKLRSAGLVEYPQPDHVALTPEGREKAAPPVQLSVHEMQDALCRKVGPSKAAILQALIALYPKAITKDELAARIGVSPTSGGYFNNLGALRTLGVIDYPMPGSVQALPVLFLEGR